MSKNELEKEFRKFGYTKDKGFMQLGFIFNNLYNSQAAYLCINQLNKILSETAAINISIFFMENMMPCVQPLCARFYLRDGYLFTGYAIATCAETAKSLSSIFNRSKRYWYIQDLSFLDERFKSKEILDVLSDDNIEKIVRSQDYYDHLTKLGYKINSTIVEDFNIMELIEIINKE